MAEIPLQLGSKKRPANAESRAWVRYPCNAEVSFQPIDTRKDGGWHPAKLKNVSAKGLGLSLDTAVQRGAILSVKLEGASQRLSRPLLVRVVRVTGQPGSGYQLGCTFAIPLGEDELRALLQPGDPPQAVPEQGDQPPPGEGPDLLAETNDAVLPDGVQERRVFPRRRIAVPVILSHGSAQENAYEALAIDASIGGLRLLAVYSFGRGTILRVRSIKAPRGSPSVQVRVRSCSPQQSKWVIGAQFLEPPPSEVMQYFS